MGPKEIKLNHKFPLLRVLILIIGKKLIYGALWILWIFSLKYQVIYLVLHLHDFTNISLFIGWFSVDRFAGRQNKNFPHLTKHTGAQTPLKSMYSVSHGRKKLNTYCLLSI